MTWHLSTEPDDARTDVVTAGLVAHNTAASEMVRLRFEPQNLPSTTVAAYAVDESDEVVGGCVGKVEDVWHWLTIDLLWLRPDLRGTGAGRALVASVEKQARERGCLWSKLNTWEFQAPEFYAALGYEVYAREVDYPPGHVNHYMRKDL